MYNLTLHIEYLLLRHDCVIVPGLGALINVRRPARYDEERKVWMPMTREVRFNAALTHDDGLLTSSYARKEQVSFAEGRELVRRASNQLLDTLHNDGEVTLGRLGTLRYEEGSIIFNPLYTADRLSAIMGYGEVKAPKEEIAEKAATGAIKEDAADEEPSREASNRKFDTDRNYYIAVNKMFARVAACMAIVLVASLALVLPPNRKTNLDKASVVPVEHIIKTPAQKPTIDNAEKEEQNIEVEVEETPDAKPSTGRYHAIVATFATEAEAERYVTSHADERYNLQVVNGRTKSRVSAYNSDNRTELIAIINDKEFGATFGGAWIWDAE